jgi:anti-sigma-K factor RskA
VPAASPSGHVDPETLALLALGESGAPDDAETHLGRCARCRSELDQLSALVHTGRTVTHDDEPRQPPPRVWDAIAAQVEAERGGVDTSPPVNAPSARPRPSGARTALAPPTVLDAARRRRAGWSRRTAAGLAAAACLGVAAGVGGTWLAVREDGSAPTPAPLTLATGALDALAVDGATGAAEVQRTDGGTQLTVQVDGIPAEVPGGGFYEVWLLDEAAERLVSVGHLGPAEGGSFRGTFQVPAAVDLAEYRVVDVSVEPVDGDPTHSSVSAVRGVLSF